MNIFPIPGWPDPLSTVGPLSSLLRRSESTSRNPCPICAFSTALQVVPHQQQRWRWAPSWRAAWAKSRAHALCAHWTHCLDSTHAHAPTLAAPHLPRHLPARRGPVRRICCDSYAYAAARSSGHSTSICWHALLLSFEQPQALLSPSFTRLRVSRILHGFERLSNVGRCGEGVSASSQREKFQPADKLNWKN